MAKENMNGSVDLIAKAMRRVFAEEVEKGLVPVRGDIAEVKEDVAGVKRDIKTTNKNMQVQFAEQKKKIGNLIAGH